LKAVLGTCILKLSALLKPDSPSARIVKLCGDGLLECGASPAMIEEYSVVLADGPELLALAQRGLAYWAIASARRTTGKTTGAALDAITAPSEARRHWIRLPIFPTLCTRTTNREDHGHTRSQQYRPEGTLPSSRTAVAIAISPPTVANTRD
jgi:hypothetical protein